MARKKRRKFTETEKMTYDVKIITHSLSKKFFGDILDVGNPPKPYVEMIIPSKKEIAKVIKEIEKEMGL